MATSYKRLYEEASAELERVREVVDLAGIARHMRVGRLTPQQWRQREHLNFPPVDFPDIKEPLWYASTIKAWAREKRRIWYDSPDFEPGDEVSPAA